jgi:hypothetical protein
MSDSHFQTMISNLELMFSPVEPAPRVSAATRLIEHRVSGGVFERLLTHWLNMPVGSRPRLRGLSVSRDPKRELILLLEVGVRAPLLNLRVEGGSFPSLRAVWPHGAWWEHELRGFEGVSFPTSNEGLGVEWRRA